MFPCPPRGLSFGGKYENLRVQDLRKLRQKIQRYPKMSRMSGVLHAPGSQEQLFALRIVHQEEREKLRVLLVLPARMEGWIVTLQ